MKRLLLKIIRDLFGHKVRTVFSLLAIIIGSAAFGGILFTYTILERELVNVYSSIVPASATVTVAEVDDRLLALTGAFDSIESAEVKGFHKLRLKTGEDTFKNLWLYGIENFENMKINKVFFEEGKTVPAKGEILLERNTLAMANAGLGDNLVFSFSDSYNPELTLTGITHDMSVPPGSMENIVYAYTGFDTLKELGLKPNRLDLILKENRYERSHIIAVVNRYVELLEEKGYQVEDITIPENPGLNPHQAEYDSVIFILQIFSIIVFILGSIIVISLITTILSSQVKQIGILKAVGAKTATIFIAYLAAIFCMVLFTTAVSLPLGIMFARFFATFTMGMSNFAVYSTAIPWPAFVVFFGFSLLLPLILAYFPVKRGTAKTVKDALADYGVAPAKAKKTTGENKKGTEGSSPVSLAAKLFSKPVLLSIRNAVRRKGRFYANITALTLGGAIFITAIVCISSMQNTIAVNLETIKYDYEIETAAALEEKQLQELIKTIPGVERYETWGKTEGALVYSDGRLGNTFEITALAPESEVFSPEVMEGRWLEKADTNHIVVGHHFLVEEPSLKIGDTVKLRVDKKEREFIITGSIKELAAPSIYLNIKSYASLVSPGKRRTSIKLDFTGQVRGDEKEEFYRQAEKVFQRSGITIRQSRSADEHHQMLAGHGSQLIFFFLVLSVLIVIVVNFGLASTMSIQVLERTKEIGIMKAIGASARKIRRIVTAESLYMGLISWLISIVIAVPFSIAGCAAFGAILIRTPLDLAITPVPFIIWLLLTIVFGYLASRNAARTAVKMSIKDSLSYE